MHGAAATATRLHLDLLPGFRAPGDWGGVSGAPVIVRDQVVGVIVATPTKAEHRLKAVFAADLFKAAGFAEKLGYGGGTSRTAALKAALRGRLEAPAQSSTQARAHLRAALAEADDTADALTERLLVIALPEDVVAVVRAAHDAAVEQGQLNAATLLRDLLLTLLPARFEQVAVRSVRGAIEAGADDLVDAGVFTGTAAELVMAEIDGQPAELRSPDDDQAWPYPDGIYAVEHPPIDGMQDQVEDGAYKAAWDQHIVDRWAKGGRFERAPLAARLKVAARRLEVGGDNKRTHYVLIADDSPDEGTEGKDIHARRAALVRQSCPSLVFLRLTADGERLERETELLDPLCPMLVPLKEPDR